MGSVRAVLVALLAVVVAASNSQPPESAGDQYRAKDGVAHWAPIGPLEASAKSAGATVNKTPRVQRAIEPRRGKQWDYYSQWSPQVVHAPASLSFSMWQPQVYQIKRPYYIPIWSSPGKIPIYFPPQPLYTNPGYPADNNPRKSHLPSGPDREYLPTHPQPTTENTPIIIDKFNEDAPIWDSGDASSHRTTTTPSSAVVPTRRRRPGKTTTLPPLVRNRPPAGNQLSPIFPEEDLPRPPALSSTAAPSPSRSPQQQQQSAGSSRQPSRCVWAIISCCSATSGDVSYSCFEQLGCTGAFWDNSPCESDFARAAIATAMNYYNQ